MIEFAERVALTCKQDEPEVISMTSNTYTLKKIQTVVMATINYFKFMVLTDRVQIELSNGVLPNLKINKMGNILK